MSERPPTTTLPRRTCAITVLSLDGRGTAAAAAVLGVGTVVPAHYDGWEHFSEGRAEIELAFHEAGISRLLHAPDHGTWVELNH